MLELLKRNTIKLTEMNALTNDQLFQVCAAYENIKRRYVANKLTAIPLKNLDEAPSISGIYLAVTDTGEILYIGMSKNLKMRCDIRTHHKLPDALKLGAEVLLIARVDESIVEYVEKSLIMYFNPKLNQRHTRIDDFRFVEYMKNGILCRAHTDEYMNDRNRYSSAKFKDDWRKKELMHDINLPPDVPF